MIGLDLHGDAVGAIGTSEYTYRRYKGRAVNDLGNWVTEYEDDELRDSGNVQPVSLRELNQNGLNTSITHIKIWDTVDFQSVDRNQGADRCVYNGDVYEILPNTTRWFTEDGWCESIWVKQVKK